MVIASIHFLCVEQSAVLRARLACNKKGTSFDIPLCDVHLGAFIYLTIDSVNPQTALALIV